MTRITVDAWYAACVIARIALCTVWLCGTALAVADPGFIPSPLPAELAAPAPTPPPATSAEIERAAREVRQKLELEELARRGSRTQIDAYRARELRELEVEKTMSAPPRGDAERVRADIDRARERIELERRVDRTEDPMRTQAPGGR